MLKMFPIIVDIYRAWNDPGVNPEYHRRMQNMLRTEWPTLATSLDRLTSPKK